MGDNLRSSPIDVVDSGLFLEFLDGDDDEADKDEQQDEALHVGQRSQSGCCCG